MRPDHVHGHDLLKGVNDITWQRRPGARRVVLSTRHETVKLPGEAADGEKTAQKVLNLPQVAYTWDLRRSQVIAPNPA